MFTFSSPLGTEFMELFRDRDTVHPANKFNDHAKLTLPAHLSMYTPRLFPQLKKKNSVTV